ncbi:hypothetical protein IWQ57_000014 [Coemansia nantahalensis]|uniref:Uncharacterized protein n=2 Tax=Coemansia TaxID=4863 RepID=A0ACC1KYQ9_9FUNG|nr:hypothetical protein IWQ57_000014 [Coemansia nantahalensis]KAJ2797503.1 hypothetical protein H4R21_004297 [Coemansia helicoidea]
MVDAKGVASVIIGIAVFAVLVGVALSARARVARRVLERRSSGSRRYRRAGAMGLATRQHTLPPRPAPATLRPPSVLPQYEPPPPAYTPPKVVVHAAPLGELRE